MSEDKKSAPLLSVNPIGKLMDEPLLRWAKKKYNTSLWRNAIRIFEKNKNVQENKVSVSDLNILRRPASSPE